MQKLIFYIKAFFLIIKLLLQTGYKPDWLDTYDLEQYDARGSEVEYFSYGGLEKFAKCFVKEIQLALYFKNFHMGETWYYRNEFYKSYKKLNNLK